MSQYSYYPGSTAGVDTIDELIERVTVDAYGDAKQTTAFWQWLYERARLTRRRCFSVALSSYEGTRERARHQLAG